MSRNAKMNGNSRKEKERETLEKLTGITFEQDEKLNLETTKSKGERIDKGDWECAR